MFTAVRGGLHKNDMLSPHGKEVLVRLSDDRMHDMRES